MKVIFMGTPDFSTGVLESIIEAGHEVTAVVTQPDKPKGRGHEMQFTPVKEVALKYNLPVLQPKKIRDPEVVAQLEEIPADICVVVAFGQIIPKSILEMKKFIKKSEWNLMKIRFMHIRGGIINGIKKNENYGRR